MQLKVVVNADDAELNDHRNVQYVTEGFFSSEPFKFEGIDVVVTLTMYSPPDKAQCQYLEHLCETGKIQNFQLYKDNGNPITYLREEKRFLSS